MSKLLSKHIEIDGRGYALYNSPDAPSYQMLPAPLYENRFAQGDRSFGDFKDWWYWAQDLFEFVNPPETWSDDGRFAMGIGIDGQLFPGKIGSGAAVAGTLRTVVDTNILIHAASPQTSNNWLLFGRNVTTSKAIITDHTFTTVWEPATTGATAVINCATPRPGEMECVLFGCGGQLGGASTLKTITGSSTIADVGTESSAIKASADGGDGFVYYLRADKKIRSYNAVSEALADVADLPAGSASDDWLVDIVGNGDKYFDVVGGWLYTVDKRNQLWGYSLSGDSWTMIRKFTSVRSIKGFNGKLYILDTKFPSSILFSWDGASLTIVQDFGPGTAGYQRSDGAGADNSSKGIERTAMQVVSGNLFIPLDFKDVFAAQSTSIYKPLGMSWTEGTLSGSFAQVMLRMDTEERTDPYIDLMSSFQPITDYYKIFVLGPSGQSGPGGQVIGVRNVNGDGDTKLYHCGINSIVGAAYPRLYTSWFDGNLPNVDKHFEDILINSGDWIVGNWNVYYRTHESEAFTQLKRSEYYSTYKWTKSPLNITAKKIQLVLELPFGTSGGLPVFVSMDSFMVRYLPKPAFLREWNVILLCADNIEMPDGSMEEQRGEALKSYLEALYVKGSPVPFKDYNYATSILDGAITKTQPSTTTSGAETAGNNVVVGVTLATGFLEGGYMKFTDGDKTEWALITDVTGNNITVKRLNYAHGGSTAVLFDSIKVDNANEFPFSGVMRIGGNTTGDIWQKEYVHYMERTTHFIHKITRGYRDTVPLAQADDTPVTNITQVVVKHVDFRLATTGDKSKEEFIANVRLVETI